MQRNSTISLKLHFLGVFQKLPLFCQILCIVIRLFFVFYLQVTTKCMNIVQNILNIYVLRRRNEEILNITKVQFEKNNTKKKDSFWINISKSNKKLLKLKWKCVKQIEKDPVLKLWHFCILLFCFNVLSVWWWCLWCHWNWRYVFVTMVMWVDCKKSRVYSIYSKYIGTT